MCAVLFFRQLPIWKAETVLTLDPFSILFELSVVQFRIMNLIEKIMKRKQNGSMQIMVLIWNPEIWSLSKQILDHSRKNEIDIAKTTLI